jgi:hypothetical protein
VLPQATQPQNAYVHVGSTLGMKWALPSACVLWHCGHPVRSHANLPLPAHCTRASYFRLVSPAVLLPRHLLAQIPLMYRMATDLDQKDPHAEKRSRYLWKVRSATRHSCLHVRSVVCHSAIPQLLPSHCSLCCNSFGGKHK